MIYELATSDQKKILNDMYDVKPFKVQTITLERIFVDKLFAAEAYVRKTEVKSRAFEAAKHIYDLTVMAKLPRIIDLINNEEPLEKLLDIRMKEEMGRLDGIPGMAPNEFILFDDIKDNKLIVSAYETMQRQYVLRECDRIPYEEVLSGLENIRAALNKNAIWKAAIVPDMET